MAKKKTPKIQTPEDNDQISVPEDGSVDQIVCMIKTRTNSFGPLGDFYRNKKYQVPFSVFLELHRLGEAELAEDE